MSPATASRPSTRRATGSTAPWRRLARRRRRPWSCKWGDLYAAPLTPPQVSFANPRTTDRPLRIGYIGPSFTRNQVAQFILPVLEAHDPEAVAVHLYCADPDAEAPLPATCTVRKI